MGRREGQTNQDNTILTFFDEFVRDSRCHEENFGLTEVQSAGKGPISTRRPHSQVDESRVRST